MEEQQQASAYLWNICIIDVSPCDVVQAVFEYNLARAMLAIKICVVSTSFVQWRW